MIQKRFTGKNPQSGLTLLSTLIVGIVIAVVLVLGLKTVPVFTEYLAIKGALNKIVKNTDAQSPASAYRAAFSKFAEIDDISSVDPQTIVVTKENGTAFMSVDYERRVPLFAMVSLVFNFSAASDGAPKK